MKQLFFLILIISWTISANGQVIENRIHKQIDSLKISKVDTFLIYSLDCEGEFILFDSCSHEKPQYLFWMKDKKCFIKKFDYCGDYRVVLLDTINPLSFYIKYKAQINKEEIRKPTYIQSKKDNIIMTSIVDHDCSHQMTFYLQRATIIKKASDYNLTFKFFGDGKKNMYYDYNQKTKLKVLITQISKLVEQLNTHSKL